MEEINLEAESSEPIYARPIDKDSREVHQIAASLQINLGGSLLGNLFLNFIVNCRKNDNSTTIPNNLDVVFSDIFFLRKKFLLRL